jgi:hypothetical protein
VTCPEYVVEVPAGLAGVTGRTVGAADVQTGHGDDVGRQEGPLQGRGQDTGTCFGCLGPAAGRHQFALVSQSLAGVEHDRADDHGLTVIVPLEQRIHEHGQPQARGACHRDGYLPEHPLHEQHQSRMGVVEDAVARRQQILKRLPASLSRS